MRVVLDTNILVSALLTKGGIGDGMIEAWQAERFTLISHDVQIDELREVSRRPWMQRAVKPAVVGRLINCIRRDAVMPDRLRAVSRSPDPRDDYLLALCEAGGVDWLVTGDKGDLLALGSHGGTRIVTARAFAAVLG
ncbi:putative toxin-antitoxin system toxin component, PIN family [Sandaracinobacteroides saxicola]|uniref:Putative toxin-antitoxin system toxin component, PIN family n=1 Tax=Sandaracinobacteroides saxicola TaxID=2759707 RepID=A0A7G5IIC9_9SPHN|nr:putative toxin-antitoxin system toxin component, PIN family [Sandaracinobacteroides saxicola]QMW23121.1 putative toxin-antitoxin system toxin component, PIN family [Sandaracinobacteroides saxicola]